MDRVFVLHLPRTDESSSILILCSQILESKRLILSSKQVRIPITLSLVEFANPPSEWTHLSPHSFTLF